MERGRLFVSLLVIVLVVSFGGLISNLFYKLSITGAVTVQNVTSRVVIENYFSISASNNLSSGIDFGTIQQLPTDDANGTGNYNWTDSNNRTEYSIAVSTDSNVNVDFCIKANGNLNTSGGQEILLGNETWNDSITNNYTHPNLPGTSFTTSYVKGSTNVAPGNSNYYRFWLDIPAATQAGTYNNTVSFKGVQTGSSC